MGHCLFGTNEAQHKKKQKKRRRRWQLPGHFGFLTIMGALLSPFSLLRFMVRLFEKVEAPFKDNALRYRNSRCSAEWLPGSLHTESVLIFQSPADFY